MAILNQDLEFNQLPIDVRRAFSGASAAKVLLPANTSIYRFSQHSNISAWWSELNQLPKILLAAKASGLTLFQYLRKTTAVLRQWDPGMTNLVVGSLQTSVYGFSGRISPQNEASSYMNSKDLNNYKKKFTKPVNMSGGNGQVYVKDLSGQHVSIIVPAGTINIYDKPDDIIDFLVSYKLV